MFRTFVPVVWGASHSFQCVHHITLFAFLLRLNVFEAKLGSRVPPLPENPKSCRIVRRDVEDDDVPAFHTMHLTRNLYYLHLLSSSLWLIPLTFEHAWIPDGGVLYVTTTNLHKRVAFWCVTVTSGRVRKIFRRELTGMYLVCDYNRTRIFAT